MSEHQDFALLLEEYARLKTKHEQLQSERKWLLEQVKSKHNALSKAQKALQRLQTERAQERYEKRPTKKPSIGDWAYRVLYIISACLVPLIWCIFLIVAINEAKWDLNVWALVAVLLIIVPLSVLLTVELSKERRQWQHLYRPKAAAPIKQVGEAAQPAEKQRGKTPRRITEKSRAPITRKLTEEELELITHAL